MRRGYGLWDRDHSSPRGRGPSISERLPSHMRQLQEPDQAPFWLWGQGRDGLGGRHTVPHGPRQVRPG